MKTIKLFSKVKWLVVTCLMLLTCSPQVWAASGTITAASTTDLGKGNTPRYVVEQAGVGRLMKNATGSSSWSASDGKLTTGSKIFALQTYNAISSIVINGYGTGSGRTFSSMRVGTTTGNYAAASATGSGTMSSTESSQTITITPASTIAANSYVEITLSGNIYIYSVELVYAGGGGGTSHNVSAVTSTGTNTYGSVSAGSATVVEGGTTTITATPAAGYRVTNWAVSGTGASISPTGASNSNTTTLTMGTANATVTVTFGAIPSHTITYTNTKSMDNSANPTSYYEGVGVASFTKLRHAVGYDFTGWSPSSISSSATTNQTIEAQWSANAVATGTGTLTYALAFGSGTITTTSITRNNGALYDATDVSIAHTSFNDGAAKNGCSGKLTTTEAKDASNYVELTFKIADGYTFTPTEVQVRGNAVSTAKTMEVELKDNAATPNTKSVTGSLAAGSTDGGTTVTLDFDASGTVTLEGTVTLKIFVYGATNHWRLGTSIIVNGTVASAAPPSCSAPAEPTISGTTSYTYGGTITLTANCASGADASTTYTWYKGDTWGSKSQVQAAAVAGSNGHIYTKSAVVADTGTYWCEASNGTGCEAHNSTGKAITVAKADLTCTPGTGSASSITTTGATLPFTLTNTTGVGSVTIKIYNNSTDALVKTVSGITAATSGSQAVTDLSSNTTYYYKVTPIGDANHNDGSESAKSSTFTTLTQTYTVQFAASPNTYGTVSTSSVTVNEGTTVSSQTNNVLTVGSNTITATVTNDANYICRFANWVWSGHSWPSTVTSDMTISAVFTRKNIAPEITFSNDMSNIVTISNNGVGTIYYTTDGSTPTDGSTLYSAPFVIGENTTVKARVISNPTLVQNSDVASLTCTYTPTSYTVTYDGSDATGGDVPTDENSPYTSGSTVTVLGNSGNLTKAFDATPATFIGWNTNSNTYGGTHYDADDQFTISGNTTLYAVWGYPITYDADGGTINDASYPTYYICTYPYDDATTTLPSNVTKDGHTFVGWKTENGSGTIITEITGDYTGAFTGDYKLKAIWSEVGYSVTYAANGGSGSVPTDANTYSPNAEVTVLGKNTLSKSGYTFCGWSYNGYVYVEGDKFEITEDATLTAVWNQNATTVTITNFETSKHNKSNNKPDSQNYYLFGYKGSVSDANAVTLTTTSSNNYGQNSGVEIRVDNSSTLRIYADNATSTTPSSFSNVTNVAFEAKLYNSGNSERTTGYTIKVGGTTVGSGNVVGVAADGYKSISTGTFSATNGYVDIILGSGNSNNNLYVDNIAITYSTSTYKKVTFNKGSGPSTVSGLPADRYVPSGSKISRPATDPTATGYIFNGWVTTSGGSTPFDFSGTITTDKTIYAKWTAKTQPTQYTVSGDTYYCPGSTATITLSSSESGASYQLKKNGSAQGDPKAGTGSALSWTGLTAGTYTISAVETATYAARDMSGSVTVAAAATTDISTQPTTSVSATASVNFTLGSGMVTAGHGLGYQWYSYTSSGGAGEAAVAGAQSATYTTSKSAGTYYYKVKVSGDCGDPVYSNMITVTVKIAPTVYSLSGEPTALCGGTATLTLSGSDDGLTYKLYKGGVDQSDDKVGNGNKIEWTGIDAAGTYTVKTVETSTYAEATMSGSVIISIMTPTSITTQPTTSVTGHDGVNFTLGSNLVGAGEGTLTYQWYSYSNSSGDNEATVGSATTTKTLTTSKSAGTYYYKVEVIGSCGSVKSNMITVTVDNKHLLSFSANSGSGSVPGSAYYAPSASVTLNSTTIPTRSGYVFLGWNTNSTGTGDMYQPGATYTMPATATTLYAAWGSPCFSFSKGTKGTEPEDGFVITPSNINSSVFTAGATLSGGNMTNTSGAKLGINGSYGFVMVKSTRELTITLTGGQFQAGTVIALEGYTNNENSKSYGFALGSVKVGGTKSTESTGAYTAFSQRYVVVADDGIEGTSSVVVKMNGDCTGSQTYLSAIYIGGCMSCTGITPTLSYGTTNLYLLGGANTASPTITGNTGSGAVTYSSSNTSAVDVNASTGVITAVAPGTATITARIASSGDYCGGIASVEITVLSLVQQTVNLNAAWSTVPNMTFPGDPTSTLTRNANIAATGYSIDESNNKSGLTSRIYGIPSSTSKNDSYYMSFSFKTPDYGVRLTSVVVPIQPITNTVSAIVTVSDGTTTLTSNEEADIPDGAKKTCTFAITPTVFAAGKTITVKIFVYDQTGDKGFRFGSPILVNGSVITSGFTFTGEGANANWSTTANWNWGILPTINNDVVVEQPVVIDVAHATAKSVVLDQSSSNEGSIDIPATGALVIAQTLKKTTDGETKVATEATDVYIHSTSSGTGALVIGSHDGTNQATVEFYSLGRKNNEGKKVYQYIGTPFNDVADAQYNYYGSWMYRWNADSYSWTKMSNGMPVVAFMGYSIAQPSTDPRTYWMQGTLVSSANVAKDLVRHEVDGKPYENMFANSWMAPISLAAMDEDDFVGADATIYIFNTGSDAQNAAGGGGWGSSAGQTTAVAGQYTTAPIKTSGWMAEEGNQLTVIPSMQAFSVAAPNSGNATLTLNYSKHVLTPALTSVSIQPNRAPSRRNAASSRPPMLRLFVNGESFGDQLWMFMRNDFSLGFDNGYDGRKLVGDSKAPQLYATTPDGNMAIHCTPVVDGTILGFKPGQDASYTFSFIYDGDETLYLNDLKTETSTLIREGNTYNFTYEDGDAVNRFMISVTPFAKTTPTGIEDADWNGTGVQKVIYKDHMYIIRGGRVFDATGGLVK